MNFTLLILSFVRLVLGGFRKMLFDFNGFHDIILGAETMAVTVTTTADIMRVKYIFAPCVCGFTSRIGAVDYNRTFVYLVCNGGGWWK